MPTFALRISSIKKAIDYPVSLFFVRVKNLVALGPQFSNMLLDVVIFCPVGSMPSHSDTKFEIFRKKN